MIRQRLIQGDSQIDWIGFVSDHLVTELQINALKCLHIVEMKSWYTRLESLLVEKMLQLWLGLR